jgi:hypothetical protein
MHKEMNTKKGSLVLILLLILTFSILLAFVAYKRLVVDRTPAELGSTTSPTKMGTMTLITNNPIYYHQLVEFYYVLPRKPQLPNFVVTCRQDSGWVFAAEGLYHPEITPRSLEGTISILIENESQTLLLGGLDYTKLAHCGAYLIEEGTRNGKMSTFGTSVAGFDVLP